MPDILLSSEGLTALVALTAMETLLGIDNVLFIAVLISRLRPDLQEKVRGFGLGLALLLRLGMLLVLTTLLFLAQPVFSFLGVPVSWRDIILVGGGLFLIVKAAHELLLEAEGGAYMPDVPAKPTSLVGAIVQIAVINLVFSIDSTVTAIGMSRSPTVMAIAITISMVLMYVAAGWVASFVSRHPGAKLLALGFLLLIGVMLLAEGLHNPIDRWIIYTAMFLAAGVAAISMAGARNQRRQLRARRRSMRALQRAADESSGVADDKRS